MDIAVRKNEDGTFLSGIEAYHGSHFGKIKVSPGQETRIGCWTALISIF